MVPPLSSLPGPPIPTALLVLDGPRSECTALNSDRVALLLDQHRSNMLVMSIHRHVSDTGPRSTAERKQGSVTRPCHRVNMLMEGACHLPSGLSLLHPAYPPGRLRRSTSKKKKHMYLSFIYRAGLVYAILVPGFTGSCTGLLLGMCLPQRLSPRRSRIHRISNASLTGLLIGDDDDVIGIRLGGMGMSTLRLHICDMSTNRTQLNSLPVTHAG